MFSVPNYPRSDNYYSHKGQIIRRRRMDTPAPLSPQQLQQAYDYFVARSILFPPTPPPDTNIYLFYGPTTSDEISERKIVHISDFPTPSTSGSPAISPSVNGTISIVAIINYNDQSRIYFYCYRSSIRQELVCPYPYTFLYINVPNGSTLRGGINFIQYLFYLSIEIPQSSRTVTSSFLSELPYITVIES